VPLDETGSNPGSKPSATGSNSEQLRPLQNTESRPVRLDRSGWGPGYRKELFFGCYADPDALPDAHELPALIEAELQELGRASMRAHAGGAT
jgi:hypothetical protein